MLNIVVKFDLEGVHSWPDAPDVYAILRSRHGHIFHFEAYIPVGGDNRELEFLDVRRRLISAVQQSFRRRGPALDFRSNSCEMLANHLAGTINNIYQVVPTKVIVMEDAFVGAEWTIKGEG